MNEMNLRRAVLSLAIAVPLSLTANAQYVPFNLVTDGGSATTLHVDRNLINPWGLASSPTGPFWVAANGTSKSTVYDSKGNAYPPNAPIVVNVGASSESAPTGIVFNGTDEFKVAKNGVFAPARFIFVTEDGTISGWSPIVDPKNAVPANSALTPGAVYKGAALAAGPHGTLLYATNFRSGFVEVYNGRWGLVGTFTDPNIPDDYGPFGIQNINGYLIVTYAKADAEREDDVAGLGNGYVDMFTPTGKLVRRIASHGSLNSPWGIALAPKNFGPYSNNLLIGNFGDGRINAFVNGGKFNGLLRTIGNQATKFLTIPGLWALKFGNGGLGGDLNKLYFTAGPGDEKHGAFGYIRVGNGNGSP